MDGYDDLKGGILPSADDREEEDGQEVESCERVPSTTRRRLCRDCTSLRTGELS